STKTSIIQGEADTVVLPQLTESFSQKFVGSTKMELHLLPQATHAFPKAAGPYQDILANLAAAWLPAKA
ncbi:MAG: hypothetical protein AAGD96_10855, partial [Chloroflexota bacterium]